MEAQDALSKNKIKRHFKTTAYAVPGSFAVQSLFRFVCEMAKDLGATRVASRAAMPFYAAVLCEYIAAVPTVTEPLVTFLLPYLAHGLTADVTSDYRAATYMALVQLTTRATLTEALIDGIVLELCKSTTPAGLPQALLVLCHLSVTQPHFAAFPEAGFKHLAKLPGLTAELKKLVEKGSRAQALVTMMAAVAAELVPAHGAYAKLMDDIVGTVPLGPGARAAAEQLLSCALSTQHGDAGKARLVAALRGLDQRYPAACEAAVNAALKGLEGGDKGEEAGAAKEKLVSILEEAFAGSLRSPLLEAGATLAVAVDAASAHNRRLALEKLDSMAADAQVAATEGEAGEAEGVLRGALLRRLADDSPTVVQTVLGLQSLLRLPPAALLEGLSTCLSTALAAANKKQTRKSDRAAARGIAKKVIKVLTGPFAAEHPGEVERIADLVLPAALASAHTKKVAQTAVKRGQKLGHPLLQALHNMPSGHSAQKESPQKKGKKAPKKKAAPAEPKGMNEDFHNAAVLLALAERVASDASALEALAKMLSSAEPRAQALALAVANAALHSGAGDDLATIVLARFTASGGSIPARSLFEAPAVAFESDSGTGVASPASLLALARGTLSAASIEPPAVLASISLLSADGLLQLGRQVRTQPI